MAQETTDDTDRAACLLLQNDSIPSPHLSKELHGLPVSRLISDHRLGTAVDTTNITAATILAKRPTTDQYRLSSNLEASSSESSSSKITTNQSIDDQESLESDVASNMSCGGTKFMSTHDAVESWLICGERVPAPRLRISRPRPNRRKRIVNHIILLMDDGSKWCDRAASRIGPSMERADQKVSSSQLLLETKPSNIANGDPYNGNPEEETVLLASTQTTLPSKSVNEMTDGVFHQISLSSHTAIQDRLEQAIAVGCSERTTRTPSPVLKATKEKDGLLICDTEHTIVDNDSSHDARSSSEMTDMDADKNRALLTSHIIPLESEELEKHGEETLVVGQDVTPSSTSSVQSNTRNRKTGVSMIPRSCHYPSKRTHPGSDASKPHAPLSGKQHPAPGFSHLMGKSAGGRTTEISSSYLHRQLSKIPVRDVRAQNVSNKPKKSPRAGGSKLPTRMSKH
ncbi:hypothetical protein DFQ29_000914 [Apophysomyces sp. BC1021]|nr:hypothetical protein DFQ29_000914 [Apophysomyces sp. BC1021]